MTMADREVQQWHRRLCVVTPWLAVSGDLNENPIRAAQQLDEWLTHGITDIVDVRAEWSDEALVNEISPTTRYHYLGTHDDGGAQSDDWFDAGIDVLRAALRHPEASLMVHCHMGINRGPSMAYAYLLEQGWDVVPALNALRTARPIAAIAYASDALRAHCRRHSIDDNRAAALRSAQDTWFEENAIDVRRVIRLLRQQELDS